MVGRPYIATHVDPLEVAPLLARVLPKAGLSVAETAVRDHPELLRGAGPHPAAEVLVAQALGGSDPTAGAVLFALQHELRPVMEELAAATPEELAEELSVCELMERRQPAHIVLALLLDGRPQVNSLGTALLDEYSRLRETVEEKVSTSDDWLELAPLGETVLASATDDRAPSQPPGGEGDVMALLSRELEAMKEENRALLTRIAQLEEKIAGLLAVAPASGPPVEEAVGEEPVEAPTAPEPVVRENSEDALEDALTRVVQALETPSPPPAMEAPAQTAELPPLPAAEPERAERLLSGEHILLLGGDPLRKREYEAMLRGIGARPMVVPEVDAWDDLQIRTLVSEADYVVALGNTILDVNVARILRAADERGVRCFRYHSTAVAGARHFLLSLAAEGLI
ncbi:hypothetical protein HS125_01590 [bacterium]|nr:hypothetical protein [bacterium]